MTGSSGQPCATPTHCPLWWGPSTSMRRGRCQCHAGTPRLAHPWERLPPVPRPGLFPYDSMCPSQGPLPSHSAPLSHLLPGALGHAGAEQAPFLPHKTLWVSDSVSEFLSTALSLKKEKSTHCPIEGRGQQPPLVVTRAGHPQRTRARRTVRADCSHV